jgi:ABC-type dipeptide/oligopeptide/nickel transport system permease component
VQVSAVLGGSVVIEQIFNLPGVGRMLLTGVSKRDYPSVQAGVMVTTAAVLVVNLLVDLSYALLDPRIRRG